MKIVAVTTRSPYPLIEGRALRTYNLLREAARSHEVHLCTYLQSEVEAQNVPHLEQAFASVAAVPLYMQRRRSETLVDVARDLVSPHPVFAIKYHRPAMRRIVQRLVDQVRPDVVHLDMLHLGMLLPELQGIPVVLVEHNVESALLRRRVDNESRRLVRAYLERQHRKLEQFERDVCRQARHVVAVSDPDAEILRQFAPEASVTVVPNGVDMEYFSPGADCGGSGMVYVGGLGWHPNRDAIDYFASEISARIAAERPDAQLTVVGHVPSPRMIDPWRDNPALRFTGLVDDIRPVVHAASVYVVPLRVGGGTRLKILDAMAMGKAVVSTSIGCEGLEVQHDRELLIADDPAEFARAVLRVMQDVQLRQRLGAAARDLVSRRYQWSAIAGQMEQVYQRAAGRAGG